jgi:hypothetical protein
VTTGPVQQALQQSLMRVDQGLVFGADRDFLSTLSMGQIIKGRVLRHYEGSRYGVEFGGQERVVDSTIALRSGELIHGRVVGLDDRVHLQRVPASLEREPATARPAPEPGMPAAGAAADRIEQLFREHRAALSPAEHGTVRGVGRQAGDMSLAAAAALVLRKLGLPLDATLIRALTRAMTERGALAESAPEEGATRLAADATRRVTDNHETVRLVAQALEQLRVPERADGPATSPGDVPQQPGAGADGGPGNRDRRGEQLQAWLLGRRVLNSQSEGAVAHRFLTLPLWFGDRLVEVNLAFFAQTPDEQDGDGLRYRRIVLSLDFAGLGEVEAVVSVANRHLRIAFETGREEATQLLALWMGALKADLAAFGWQIDELSYGTRYADALDGPAEAVVSHYIRQDSLSRLM